jgi:large subunit ribosomal protein L23
MKTVYDIIIKPIATEKAFASASNNQYVFEVAIDSTKPQIAQAFFEIYKVKPTAINTLVVPGKTKRFRGFAGKQKDTKKAYITLPASSAGQDFTAEVK